MTHSEIINSWPSMPALARDLKSGLAAIKSWKLRDSIPSQYWLALVEAAATRGIEGVSLKALAEAAAAKRAA